MDAQQFLTHAIALATANRTNALAHPIPGTPYDDWRNAKDTLAEAHGTLSQADFFAILDALGGRDAVESAIVAAVRTAHEGPHMVHVAALSSISLTKEMATLDAQGVAYEAYRMLPEGTSEWLEILYVPSIDRAGLAWGADAQWTDAESPEDAVERFFGINDKEMQQ